MSINYFDSKFAVIVTILAEWMAKGSMIPPSVISSQFMPMRSLFSPDYRYFQNSRSYLVH